MVKSNYDIDTIGKRRPKKGIPQEVLKTAHQLYDSGMSVYLVAKELSLSYSTISYHLVDGEKRKRYVREWRKANRDKYREYLRIYMRKQRKDDPWKFKLASYRYNSDPENKKKNSVRNRIWREKNQDKIAGYREKERILRKERRARKARRSLLAKELKQVILAGSNH